MSEESSQIVPKSSESSPPSRDLPTLLLHSLIPFNTIDLGDTLIFYFVRSYSSWSAKRNPCDTALISMKRGADTFKLHYYPTSESAQVIKDIGVEQIPQIVADLIGAGFPHR